MNDLTLGTLVTYNPWTVRAETLLGEIAERLRELRIHHVPVVDDDRRLVGMISETDILRARQARRMLAAVGGGPDGDDGWSGSSARQVMSKDVVRVAEGDSPRKALGLLIEHQIRALPVVAENQLVGVVTSRDFIRECSYGELPGSRRAVSEILQPSAETLEPETTLEQALLTMHEVGASCLAVAQDGCPLGVLTLRDIVRACCLATEEADEDLGLSAGPPNVMRAARDGSVIRPGQRLCEAAGILINERLPAVMVVNQANRLLGLITEDDILRALL